VVTLEEITQPILRVSLFMDFELFEPIFQ